MENSIAILAVAPGRQESYYTDNFGIGFANNSPNTLMVKVYNPKEIKPRNKKLILLTKKRK